MESNKKVRFAQGNEAIVEGAIAAGARFYAGYPITPSTEIAEGASIRLPQEGGMYIQMEDELGSIAAIIGASASGKKAFTATSGPGLSLMSENLGVAIMGEVPCVLVDVQRSGPSTGLATKPAQGDVMQSRWGTHGDHGIIVLSPSSVQDCFDLAIKAFNYSEKYRTPVIILSDAVIGHLKEKVVYRKLDDSEIINRKKPQCDVKDYKPFDFEEDDVAPLATYGSEYILRISGSTHNEAGFPNGSPANADKFIRHYTDKIEKHKDDIIVTRKFNLEDADYVIIAFGISARSALESMEIGRKKGMKIGVLQLITIWPFASDEVRDVCCKAKAVIVPEMNLGQLIGEIKKENTANIPVVGVNKVNSELITPLEILDKIEEVAKCL
ncbi:MAG: 2-oxoacid:acceptor oxidoreductase subunit alpha [Clostridiaceae bacterium]